MPYLSPTSTFLSPCTNPDFIADDDNTTEEVVKSKLDSLLFQKTLEIETKRENLIKKKLKTDQMEEGQLKRRLKYQVDKEYDKVLGSPGDEERILHEAYQFLMREFDARNKLHQVLISYAHRILDFFYHFFHEPSEQHKSRILTQSCP